MSLEFEPLAQESFDRRHFGLFAIAATLHALYVDAHLEQNSAAKLEGELETLALDAAKFRAELSEIAGESDTPDAASWSADTADQLQ